MLRWGEASSNLPNSVHDCYWSTFGSALHFPKLLFLCHFTITLFPSNKSLSFLHISTCFYELFDIVCIFKLGFIVFSCFKSLLLQLRLLLLLLMLSLMLRLRSFYQMKMKIIIIKKQSKHWCIVCLVHDISLYRTSCTNTSQRGQKDFGMIDIIAI